MFPSEILNVDDPVLMYDRFMEEIDLKKYLRYICLLYTSHRKHHRHSGRLLRWYVTPDYRRRRTGYHETGTVLYGCLLYTSIVKRRK